MLNRLEVANMAISHTGEGKKISSFEDNSVEGREAKQFIDVSRNTLLQGADWIFARKEEDSLELVKTNPNKRWNYGHLYPSDCLRIMALTNGSSARYPHRESLVGGEYLILSNLEKPELTYVSSNLPDRYPDDFGLAWSFYLAILLAPQLTEGNISQLISRLNSSYERTLGVATENNENSKDEPELVSDAISAGGFEHL